MRVAHCLGWYFPESVGGTEIYVRELARGLRALGIESVVLAPRDGAAVDRYAHDGASVLRYPVPAKRSRGQHDGREPHESFDVFRRLLAEAGADIFHLHSITFGANDHHLACARDLGLRAFTTVHVPDAFCERGTLLRLGREACDARIDPAQCVGCWLDAKGIPPALASALEAALPRVPRPVVWRAPGRLRTLLSVHERIARRRARLLRVAALSDRVVGVCDWLCAALRSNGVPEAKIVACRQGVAAPDPAGRGPSTNDLAGRPLRVAFFGRASPVKGLDVLIDAVARPPGAPIRLTVHALVNGAEDRDHLLRVQRRAAGDDRIVFRDPVAPEDVREAMRAHDVIAVPSRLLETGPLVAMEALAAGIPVLGSRLGGLCEIVAEGRTGWLLPPNDVAAWRAMLERLAERRPKLAWDPGEPPLLTHGEVAARMADLYRGSG